MDHFSFTASPQSSIRHGQTLPRSGPKQEQTLTLGSPKQPPMYNPPPPAWSPMKPMMNGFAQGQTNSALPVNPDLMQFTPTRAHQPGFSCPSPSTARNLLPQMNDTVMYAHQASSSAAAISPSLTGASQKLVMSMDDEFRASKVMKVQNQVSDASQQETLVALQATGWDTGQAAKHIISIRKSKIDNLTR